MQRDKLWFAVSVCAILATTAPTAHAAAVFSENFDTGSATLMTDNPYWTNSSQDNGFIAQNTGGIGPFESSQIAQDASGSGYFLFEGTASDRTVAADSEFYISSAFGVAADTTYTVSFELTNADAVSPGSIQPEIDGTLLGSPVSAVGDYEDGDGWQTFSFTWNSGDNTTASLILTDATVTGDGNDFGIDNIAVQPASAAVPEPASLPLLTAGLVSLLWLRRRRPTIRFRSLGRMI